METFLQDVPVSGAERCAHLAVVPRRDVAVGHGIVHMKPRVEPVPESAPPYSAPVGTRRPPRRGGGPRFSKCQAYPAEARSTKIAGSLG